jgi:hypothetical protein
MSKFTTTDLPNNGNFPQDDPRDDLIARLRKQVDDANGRAFDLEQRIDQLVAPRGSLGDDSRIVKLMNAWACADMGSEADAIYRELFAYIDGIFAAHEIAIADA